MLAVLCFHSYRPYKDPVLMTAQGLAIVAIFFSWGFWVTGLLGFAAFVMLQVAWCCRMNKCGLIAAGVFACLDAAGCAAVGIYLLATFAGEDDDSYYYYSEDDDTVFYYDSSAATAWGVVCLIGAFLWTGVGVCTFVFACSRLERLNQKARSEKEANETPVVVVPDQPVKKNVAGGEQGVFAA